MAVDQHLHRIASHFRGRAQLAWDAEAGAWHADIRHQLLGTGQPTDALDMMIAARSLSTGAAQVTNEFRHYERIDAPLILENWA